MASLPFFDAGSRLALGPDGRPAKNATALLFLDEALTQPATFYANNGGVPGASIGNTVVTDAYGYLPGMPDRPVWGPMSGARRVWITVNGGPAWSAEADNTAQIEAVAGGETPAGAQAKADAARDAAITAAALDATSKASAAQSAAISAAAADATSKATAAQASAVSAAAADATSKANAAYTSALAVTADRTLSNLTSAATARGNLGLGGAAVLGVGTAAGSVAAGDDARFASASLSSGTAATQRLQWLISRGIEDASVVLVGDSTGVGASAWFRVMVGLVAPSWPTHTVRYRDWNDATGVYNAPTTVQSGSGSRAIDFYNASVASTNTSHPIGQYFDARIPAIQPTICMISHGHNEGVSSTNGLRVAASYLNLTESITAACPTTDVIVVGQNPEIGNTVEPRVIGLYQSIAASRGYGCVTVHEAFLSDSRWALGTGGGGIMFDTVHPNTAGYALWAATVAPIFTTFRAQDPPVVSQQPSSLLSAQRNLLTNGDFTVYPTTPGAPDGWTAVGAPVVTRDTGTVEDTVKGWSVKITGSGSAAGEITQDVPVALVAGRVVTLTARIYVPAASPSSSGSIAIEDNTGTTVTANTNYGRDGWRWISVTRRIAAGASSCKVHIYGVGTAAAGVAHVDRAALVYGRLPMLGTDRAVVGTAAGTVAAGDDARITSAGQKLTPVATKTGAYTAGRNELVPVDASGGGFTVTLPAANVAGSVVAVRRVEFGGNTVTVSRAGSDTIGGSPTVSLGTTGGVTLVSDGAGTWAIQAESQSLTGLDSRYLSRGNNLSDLANAATARSNLGLGNVATRNVGTTVGTAAAGDDSRITGAVQRSVSTLNVKDYGATGDGTTDDTAAIQSALNAAATLGATLFFPPGTYIVAPDATYKLCLRLPAGSRGMYGDAATIKVKSGVGNYHAVMANWSSQGSFALPTTITNLVIRDLTIDQNTTGNVITDPSPGGPLFAGGFPRWALSLPTGLNAGTAMIQRVRFLDTDGVNTIYTLARDVTIDDCEMTVSASAADHDHSAIYTNTNIDGGSATITRNRITAPAVGNVGARCGIETHGGSQWVAGNTISRYFKGFNITGVEVYPGQGIRVTGNSVLRCRYGVQLWSRTYATNTGPYGLRNCHIVDNDITLDPAGWTPGAVATDVRGVFLDNPDPALSPTGLPFVDIVIDGNTIRCLPGHTGNAGDSNCHGIDWRRVYATSTGDVDRNIRITNNTISHMLGAGIRLGNPTGDYGDTFLISGNTIRNPGQGTAPAGGALASTFGSGILALGQLKNSRISDNLIVDDQVTPTLYNGLHLVPSFSGSANNEALDNRVIGAINRRVETSPSISGGWLVRMDVAAYVLPVGLYTAGSEMRDLATGITYRQRTAAEGSSWSSTSPDIQTFTANGTWTKPPGAKTAVVTLIGGGGGGGSGRRGAAASVRCAGGGGGGGAYTEVTIDASLLGSTVSVTVGTAGGGGAATTTDDTNGTAGTAGGASIFGTYARAYGGTAGGGGTASTGSAGAGGIGSSPGGNGGAASATGGAGTTAGAAAGAPGAGAGGGITSANAANAGGSGIATFGAPAGGGGGSAGAVDGALPAAGGSVTTGYPLPGGSGGGGAASITTAAQAGAAGGAYGGPGGGGGASLNGNNSGAGGAGGAGIVRVVTYL